MIAKAKSWFCLLSKPMSEVRAMLELRQMGLDVYLPLKPYSFRKVTKTGKRKRAQTVMVPAKARHLFVSFGYDRFNAAKINESKEIEAVFCTQEGIPITIGAGVIDAWQENERLGSFLTGHIYATNETMRFVAVNELPNAA